MTSSRSGWNAGAQSFDTFEAERNRWESDFVQHTDVAQSAYRRRALTIFLALCIPYLCRSKFPTRAAMAVRVILLLSMSATCAWLYLDVFRTRSFSKQRRVLETVVRISLQISQLMLAPLIYRYINFPASPQGTFLVRAFLTEDTRMRLLFELWAR